MKVLAFDMDNTFCRTSESVLNSFRKHCMNVWEFPALEYLRANENILPVCKFDKHIQKMIHDNVIIKRTYMDEAKPTELFGELNELVDLIVSLKRRVPDLKTAIVTHRGDNIDAWRSTYNWLSTHKALDAIDTIHSIDSTRFPDKVAYLKHVYETDNFLLVDDNPFGSTSVVRERCKQVLIYNGVDSFESHQNQDIYCNRDDIVKRVLSMI